MAPTIKGQARIPEKSVTSRNIHHLPPELLHMICVYLEPMDVATIRLLDRTIAAVGLQYLVSDIHLIPEPASFDRFLSVAEHPVASRYVTSLFYEADLLNPRFLLDRQSWEKSIARSDDAGPLEEVQDPYFALACDRLPKRYIRKPSANASSHQQNYTKRELQQAYQKYRSYCAEQHRMNESAVYEAAMVRAMKRLPHLSSIIMSCKRGNTNQFRAAFEAGLSEDVSLHSRMGHQLGVFQLRLLLSAADKANLGITRLVCGSIGQSFVHLHHSPERCDAMRRSLRNLRSLHLFLSHCPGASVGFSAINSLGTKAVLFQNSHITTSAPDLETLSIRFEEDRPIDPPDLKHFVLDFHWWYLASATFAKMSTGFRTLVDFCDRHAGTLRELSLTDIHLYNGTWASTFYHMRQRLELNKMALAGVIQSVAGDYWNFECGDHALPIERYIVHFDKKQRTLSPAQACKSARKSAMT